jgi:hypothetical protein
MKRTAPLWFLTTAFVVVGSSHASAQVSEALERLEVSVTAASGPVLTINRGERSGLQKGDTVIFRRAGLKPLVGIIRQVQEDSARVELDDLESGALVMTGTTGEALVPRDRAVPDGASAPDHPPWEEPVGDWAPGKPLLAPATSPAPEERPSDLNGRVFTRYQYTDDAQSDRTYARWWNGVDLDWSNPFERGGSLRFKGDLTYRDYMTGGSSTDETQLRLQRFSYAVGGNYGEKNRIEVGRFLSTLFPQFGLLDGVEYVRRLEGGDQVGGSIGFLPDYNDDLSASDDLATSVFYRWVSGPEEKLALSTGYQKTWHSGTADRDLLAGTLNWIAGPSTTVRASTLIDYYDSTAQLESSGFQLTELHLSLYQRIGTDAGVSVYGSYFDWPELLKNEIPNTLPTTIEDQKVSRVGVSGWKMLSDEVRLSGRLDGWSDNDNSGGYADLRVDWRDLLYEGSELSFGAYDTRGSFSDGLGLRIQQTHWIGASAVRLGYETVRFTQDGFVGTQSELLQHLLRLGVDTRLAEDIELNFDALQRFGDEQDALTLGLRLAWRF